MIPNRKKFYSSVGILALLSSLCVAGWIFLFYKILHQSEALAAATASSAMLEKRAQRATKLTRLAEDLATFDSKLDGYFLTEDQTIDFLDQIEKLAKSTNVTILPTDLSKNTAGELDFSIKAHGTYTSLMNFTALVEHLPYELISRQLTLELATGDLENTKGKEIIWSERFSLTLKSFVPKEITK